MNKINLKNFTFIIPVKIESEDRRRNAEVVLNFLNSNLDTNIFIYEAGSEVIPSIFEVNSENVRYFHQDLDSDAPFHRTKYLNHMIKNVQTEFTINYDVDVVLDLSVYRNLEEIMASGNVDLLFPYGLDNFTKQVNNIAIIAGDLINNIEYKDNFYNILESNHWVDLSLVGFCQVFKTSSYIEGGMEDENFISWGPEDRERYHRFCTLGYNVKYLDDIYIYHLNHVRTPDSSCSNVFFEHNWDLFRRIERMSVEEYWQYVNSRKQTTLQ